MATPYPPAVQTGNQGFKLSYWRPGHRGWIVNTPVSWFGCFCSLNNDEQTKCICMSYFFSNDKKINLESLASQHNHSLSYVGMACADMALGFQTGCLLEPGSVPVPLQDHVYSPSPMLCSYTPSVQRLWDTKWGS